MGPCGKAAAGHEESNHTSGCSYFAIHLSESGLIWSAGFSWINLTLFAHIRPASRPCPRRAPAGRPCPCWAPSAAGAAAAAAACPGARRTADPARAPRQVRVLDAPHVCAACPALALAQGGAPRAFLVGLGSLTAPRAGQQLQAAVQHATHRSTRARHPTRSAVVPTRGGRCAASLGCPR